MAFAYDAFPAVAHIINVVAVGLAITAALVLITAGIVLTSNARTTSKPAGGER